MNQAPVDVLAQSDQGEEIRLSDLLDTLLQHIWLIIGIFSALTAIGLAYAILSTPIYRADALIQVEDKKTSMLSGVQAIADALGESTSPVNGEVEILRSREVLGKAIAETKLDISVDVVNRFPLIGDWFARRHEASSAELAKPLLGFKSYAWGGERLSVAELALPAQAYERPLYLVVVDGGYVLLDENDVELAKGKVGSAVSFSAFGGSGRIAVSKLIAAPGTKFEIVRQNFIAAYRGVLANLTVAETTRQSSIIRVSYENRDVELAQGLVNAIAKAYLTQNVERRSAEADKSLDFLNEQLPQIKKSVESAEESLNSFRTRTNTISVEKEAEGLLSQTIDIERRRLELGLKRQELAQTYQPSHPMIKAIDQQLAAMKGESDSLNSHVNQLPTAQRDLLRLQRDVEVNTQIYIALLNNAQQLRVAKAGTIGNVRVIDYAVLDDQPVAPKKAVIVVIAALLGLMVGVLAAFIARVLRPTIREAAEIERATGLVTYATIPESQSQEKLDLHRGKGNRIGVEGRPQLLAALHPEDPAIESLRSLRTGMTFALMGAVNKNIVVTGATAELGKSFVSANLAVLLAAAGKRVLLIETDLRKPQLGRYFGYGTVAGLSDILAGSIAFQAAVKRGVGDLSLDVLPSGQMPPNPGELLLTDAFGKLLEEMQDQYDHILMDSAPVLPVADTLAVARHAATTFVVVRAEHSTLRELKDALRKLESAGTNVKGAIFNGVKRRRVSYGSAYKYYYGYGESK